MFLAQGINEYLGIGGAEFTGGIAGAVVSIILLVLRVAYVYAKGEKKQIDMEHQLVLLASNAFEQTKTLGDNLKENTAALEKLNLTLAGIFNEFSESLATVRGELLRNSTTRMIIKDRSDGSVMADILVSPEKDEDGNTVLVIDYEAINNDN